MPDQPSVECSTHGTRSAAFVCHHLVSGHGAGFHWDEDPDTPFSPVPDAWCSACEDVWQVQGEWKERGKQSADVQAVCSDCYADIRARNWRQDDRAINALCTEVSDELTRRQQALWDKYEIGACERWDWDQDTGALVFLQDGAARVMCDISFVGTHSSLDNSWLWGWANNSFSNAERESLAPIRSYGTEMGFVKLVGAHWFAEDDDGWLMTAFAARVLDAAGAYRTPTEHGHLYMVIRAARSAAA